MSGSLPRRRFLLAATAAAATWRPRASGAAPAAAGGVKALPALIPRRILFASADRSAVRVSPDGRRLAFLAPVGGVLNVWIGPLADVARARPFTRVTDRDLAPWLLWLPDGRHVVFFREQGGDENWQAHRVDADGGEILALTPGPRVRSYVQQVSHRFPRELLMAHNQRDPRFFDIFRVDVVTGASRLVETNDRFARHFTDSHFRVRFAVRYTDDGSVEYLQRGAGGEWELFTRVDMADAMSTRPIEVSDDGRELYWLDARGRDKAAVVAQDLATGATRVLVEDALADCTELRLDPRTYRPFVAASTFTRRRWHVVDPAYAKDHAALAKVSDGDLALVGLSDDRRHWVAYYDRDAAPGRYFHYDRATGKARFLFTARRALETAPLATMAPVVVRARDGLPLVCYLTRPRGAAAQGPMVLLVHGGPWGRDSWGWSATHQWLANRGYAALSVNFRGSTGLGKAFVNAGNLEWAGRMHDDLIDAVDWAVARGVADPARVAIFGASYGGYAALCGVTFTPETFACAIDVFGISNLMTLMNTIPPYWKPAQTLWKARMGDYTTEAGQRFLEERSPLNRVDRIVRPLLIAQGANDVRVKPSESEQIVAAMRERRIPVTYVYFTDEGHGFRRPENRRAFNAVVEAFLADHLGGRHEPVGDDFAGSTIEFKAGRNLISSLRA